MNINRFIVDTSTLPSVATSRKIEVVGDIGAECQIVILQNDTQKYYDFSSSTFELGHNNTSNLNIVLNSIKFTRIIYFPSGGGNFTIKLIVKNGTTIFNNANKNVITKNLTKLSSATTLTFQGLSISNSSNYATLPTATITGAFNSYGETEYDFAIQNINNNTHSFGIFGNSHDGSTPLSGNTSTTFFEMSLDRVSVITDIEKAFVFKTTNTVDGATSSSTSVVLDGLTDLAVGMKIVAVSSGSLSGEPFILAIDTSTKTLTLSSAQSFADGITLTFLTEGIDLLNSVLGCNFTFSNMTITPTVLTKEVRSDVSNANIIPINNTHGIAGGNITRYTGLNIDNSSENLIDGAGNIDGDGSGGNGTFVTGTNQTLTTGTVLTFEGCFAVINMSGSVQVDKLPDTNRTIHIDLDRFFSVGTQSG